MPPESQSPFSPTDCWLVRLKEYGYGDPLRIKAIPDFSIRLVDESFAEGNTAIAAIQVCVFLSHVNSSLIQHR